MAVYGWIERFALIQRVPLNLFPEGFFFYKEVHGLFIKESIISRSMLRDGHSSSSYEFGVFMENSVRHSVNSVIQ